MYIFACLLFGKSKVATMRWFIGLNQFAGYLLIRQQSFINAYSIIQQLVTIDDAQNGDLK